MINIASFINTGFDEMTVDYVLRKSMDKQGKVQKEVSVTRNGTTFTQRRWVNADEKIASTSNAKVDSTGQNDIMDIKASGAISRHDRDRMDKHAEMYYEAIRKRSGDVEAIARNTGFSTKDIRKIKEHIFMNAYDLHDGKKCFDPDYDIAVSWQRLSEGKNIKEMDLVLLNHELMEYRLMNEKGMPYDKAHAETEKLYNYDKYIRELDLKGGIK